MGNDIFRHKEKFEEWKNDIGKKYIEEGLAKPNSNLFTQYIIDMSEGLNVSNKSKKGARSPKTLNRLRSKIKSIFKELQKRGVKDISKVTAEQLHKFFNEWNEKGHTNDYAVRFKTFWGWYMKLNRKQGKLIPNICEDLNTLNSKQSTFVWITKKEFDNYRKFFDEKRQLALLFCFDSLVRSPSELFGLKVSDISQNTKGEVWLSIPDEITKTFGRRFNLIFSGEQILKHIKGKKQTDPLFDVSYVTLNKEMQRIAEQLFKDKKSGGGEYYKNITLYDLRHSGAIHFRQVFKETGQSLDALRHRGGWTTFNMLNYYTKLLGLDGYIEKAKTLLKEDQLEIQKDNDKLKKRVEEMEAGFKNLQKKIMWFDENLGLEAIHIGKTPKGKTIKIVAGK